MIHLEEELQNLRKEVQMMFALVETQLTKAHQAVQNFDKDLAGQIVLTEKRVNAQELKIDQDCENLFALYQPVAVDLRYLLAVLKINSNLERTGDIADGLASYLLEAEKPFDSELMSKTKILSMFSISIEMLDTIHLAFDNEDTELARGLFLKDKELDIIKNNGHKIVAAYIQENTNNIEQALSMISFIYKLERVGDQIKNMAEELIFYVEAKVLKHHKKKV